MGGPRTCHLCCLIYVGQGLLGALSDVPHSGTAGDCTETSTLQPKGEMKTVVGKGYGIESQGDLMHVLRLLFVRYVTFIQLFKIFKRFFKIFF